MTAQTLTLTDFLLARIQEDQVRATLRDWHQRDCDIHPDSAGYSYPCDCGVPERMRLECEAKRRIVEDAPDDWTGADGWNFYESTLSRLALPYADHPDYREGWRP